MGGGAASEVADRTPHSSLQYILMGATLGLSRDAAAVAHFLSSLILWSVMPTVVAIRNPRMAINAAGNIILGWLYALRALAPLAMIMGGVGILVWTKGLRRSALNQARVEQIAALNARTVEVTEMVPTGGALPVHGGGDEL